MQSIIILLMMFALINGYAALAEEGEDLMKRAYLAYTQGNYDKAHTYWSLEAEKGNAFAHMNLGYLYQRGLGVPKDASNSVVWYRKAAQLGLADAQYQLGLMYELGIGVNADIWEAEVWYQRATDQGYCPGELNEPGEIFISADNQK